MKRRIACAGVAAVLILLAFTALRPPSAPGGGARDLQAYLAAGHAYGHGEDPYSTRVARYEPALAAHPGAMLPFVGTPASLPLWALLARSPYAVADWMWEGFLVLSVVALALASVRLASARSGFDAVCALLLTLSFAPVDSAVALGQTAIVAAAAAALAVAMTSRTALGLGSFAAFVLQPNLAPAVLAALRRRRAAPFIAGAAVLFMLACLAAIGPSRLFAYAHVLRAHARAESGSLLQFTPAAVAASLGLSGSLLAVLAIALGVAAAFFVIRTMLGTRDPGAGFAALGLSLPFCTGFFHFHDLAIVDAGAIFCLCRVPARWFGPVLLAAVAAGTNWLDIAQSPAASLQDTALAFALILAACALRAQLDRSAILYALAAAMLVVCGTAIALHDPLPVWPDTMRAFHPGPGLSAAQQWRTELARSGLLVPNAGSALLRALALAGCAVLLLGVKQASDVDVHDRVER